MNIQTPTKIFLGLLVGVVLFHICILVKLIPYNIAWGGRLTNDNEMFVFESFSILMNGFLAWILLMKADMLKFKFSTKILNSILYVFLGLFILNTIGNIFAKTLFEKFFAILTGLSAMLIWKIIKQNRTSN